MNGLLSKKFFSLIISISIMAFSNSCLAMEAEVFTAAERAGEIGAEEGLGAAEQTAIQEATADSFGNVSESSLRPELQADLKEELTDAVKTLKSEGKLGDPQAVENELAKAKSNFLDEVKTQGQKTGGLNPMEQDALGEMNLSSAQESAIKNLGSTSSALTSAPEGVGINLDEIPKNPALDAQNVSADQVNVAQTKYNADPSAENKLNLEKAQQSYNEAASKVAQQDEGAVQSATQAKSTAKEKLAQVQSTSESPEIKTKAEEEVDDTDAELKKAEKERILNERLGSKQKYEQAKVAKSGTKADQIRETDAVKERAQSEQEMNKIKAAKGEDSEEYKEALAKYEKLNAEVRTIREKLGAEGRLKIAQEDYETAQLSNNQEEIAKARTARDQANEDLQAANEKVEAAQKEWIEKSGPLEAVGLKLRNNAIELGKSIFHNILAGFVFSIPNMVIETITNTFANMQMLKTLRSAQQFGGIWMRIPEQFIDSAQPSASKFIYVGLKDKGQTITDEYLKTAHFYVARPDYGDLASTGITDPSFPNVMLHLNTGYIFVGDGSPLHTDSPTMAILGDKGLQNELNQLAGEAARGPERKLYDNYEEKTGGYDGSEVIANRLAMPKAPTADNPDQLSPILQDLSLGLRAGVKCGIYSIKPATGIGDKLSKIVGGQKTGEVEHRIAPIHGVYLYRTQDTPSIKAVLEQVSSTETDQDKLKIIQNNLVDYVVVLDNEYNVVPLQIPIPQAPSNFALYALNPKVAYVVSLLDQKVYDLEGKAHDSSIGLANAKQVLSNIPTELNVLVEQVEAIITYCQDLLKYGPFFVGSQKLSITKELVDNNIPIYKIEKALRGKYDDYVVAIAVDSSSKQPVLTMLPNSGILFMVSLVTSRFYDNQLRLYQKPLYKDITFFVVDLGNGQTTVVTGSTGGKKVIYQGSAAYSTIFMDPDINPNRIPPNNAPLPVDPQWALGHLKIGDSIVKAAIQSQTPDLFTAIENSYNSWKKEFLLDPKNSWALENAMGPFDFTTGLLHNIVLKASSQADVLNGNYVYVSDDYPGEYLVLSRDTTGGTDLATEYDLGNPQRYAISLSNGNVYDSQDQAQPGSVVNQITALDDLTQKAQMAKAFLADLKNKIIQSQRANQAQLDTNLYSDALIFGNFQLYINKQDYLAHQYIYQDVTNLGNPLQDATVANKVTDYFICINTDSQGNQTFAAKLDSTTQQIVSLVTGSVYGRSGYQGYFQKFAFGTTQGQEIQNPLNFIDKMFGIIKQTQVNPATPIRLENAIRKLTQQTYDTILAEEKQIEQAEQKESLEYAPLNSTIKSLIDNASYLPENPNTLARYLKYVNNKYYQVTPAPQYPDDPQQLYVNYNIGEGTDAGQGMIYDAQGNAIMQLSGWILQNTRAYAGVVVGKDGKETLGIGVTQPSFALKDAQGNAVMVQATEPFATQNQQFKFFYNTQLKTYFVQISSGTKQFYVDLNSGYAYNLDGSPRLHTAPLYTSADGKDTLLLANDASGTIKMFFKGAGQMHNSYSQVGQGLPATYKDYNNAQGTNYTMSNDQDFSTVLLGYVTSDANGNPLPQPYYLIWYQLAENTFKFYSKYTPNQSLNYSTLLYIQTRIKGQPVNSGAFLDEDNSVSVALITDAKDAIQQILYKNQLCSLTGDGTTYQGTYKVFNIDTSGAEPVVTVQSTASFVVKRESDPNTNGRWISITDGNKVYDYDYDYSIINPMPKETLAPGELNLYDLKRNTWQLNQTTFIPNLNAQQNTDLYKKTGTLKTVKLVPNLAGTLMNVRAADIKNIPTTNKQEIVDQLQSNVIPYVFVDPTSGTKRFVYYMGQKSVNSACGTINNDLTCNTSTKVITPAPYFQTFEAGWYVDLYDGVLYQPLIQGSFPVGRSLLQSQLYALQAKLNVSVAVDDKFQPAGLIYRTSAAQIK